MSSKSDNSAINHLVQTFNIFNQNRIHTVFVPKDKSTVIEKTNGQYSEKTSYPGLKLIRLTTDKGKLLLNI